VKLPAAFIERVEKTFGDRGQVFVQALPTLIKEAEGRWQLKSVQPAEGLSYSFVAYARRGSEDVVLKLGVPDRELTSEIHALRHFAGRGAVKLLDSDPGRGMLLLERLRPGAPLTSIRNDAEATQIAADVMLALLRPAPPDTQLIQLADWFEGFQRFRKQNSGTGVLDAKLFKQAETSAREILGEEHRPTVLHGDLHHFNIISSGGRWVAIDPKGVVGPAAYEVGPYLLNPWDEMHKRPDAAAVLENRIALLAEVLGIERQRIRRCGITHAVLSAIWSIEEGGEWQGAMECGAVLAGLNL